MELYTHICMCVRVREAANGHLQDNSLMTRHVYEFINMARCAWIHKYVRRAGIRNAVPVETVDPTLLKCDMRMHGIHTNDVDTYLVLTTAALVSARTWSCGALELPSSAAACCWLERARRCADMW